MILSFIFAAFGCVFAGLCYAEFSSMIPVAGSAYTYGYATLGEIFAWIIGWDLVLEICFRRGHCRFRMERILHQLAGRLRHQVAGLYRRHPLG